MQLSKLGVWTFLDGLSAAESAAFVRRVEELGYSALWMPEAVGRDPFALIGYLCGHSQRLIFATGIANIYARDAMTMRACQKTLAEASGGRFLLGIGVSHVHLVSKLRGHTYQKPLAAMRAYLDTLEGALYRGPETAEKAPIVLAALGPKMLALATELTRGAHSYLVPPEHTARAREILGKGAWLCPEQKVLLETNPAKAREIGRKAIAIYVGLPNYQNNLKWLGFDDADFQNGGSNRLVDALVAWGDEDAIAERIQAHWDAGADHVAIQPLRADGEPKPDLRTLEHLAPLIQR